MSQFHVTSLRYIHFMFLLVKLRLSYKIMLRVISLISSQKQRTPVKLQVKFLGIKGNFIYLKSSLKKRKRQHIYKQTLILVWWKWGSLIKCWTLNYSNCSKYIYIYI